MIKLFLTLIFVTFMCVSCVARVGHHGASVAIAPPLPVTVELVDPYYIYGGYHYYYYNNRWYYSQSRDGHWIDLPRDHYPKEVKFKGKRDKDRGHKEDRNDDRGREGERD